MILCVCMFMCVHVCVCARVCMCMHSYESQRTTFNVLPQVPSTFAFETGSLLV